MELCRPYNEKDKAALRAAIASSSSSPSRDRVGPSSIPELPSLRSALEPEFALHPLLLWRGGDTAVTPTTSGRETSFNKFQPLKEETVELDTTAIDFSLYDLEIAGKAPPGPSAFQTSSGAVSTVVGGLYLCHDHESPEYRAAFMDAARKEYAKIYLGDLEQRRHSSASPQGGDLHSCGAGGCFVQLSVLAGERGKTVLKWLESEECGLRVGSGRQSRDERDRQGRGDKDDRYGVGGRRRDHLPSSSSSSSVYSTSYDMPDMIQCVPTQTEQDDEEEEKQHQHTNKNKNTNKKDEVKDSKGKQATDSSKNDKDDDDARSVKQIEVIRGVLCTASNALLSDISDEQDGAKQRSRSHRKRDGLSPLSRSSSSASSAPGSASSSLSSHRGESSHARGQQTKAERSSATTKRERERSRRSSSGSEDEQQKKGGRERWGKRSGDQKREHAKHRSERHNHHRDDRRRHSEGYDSRPDRNKGSKRDVPPPPGHLLVGSSKDKGKRDSAAAATTKAKSTLPKVPYDPMESLLLLHPMKQTTMNLAAGKGEEKNVARNPEEEEPDKKQQQREQSPSKRHHAPQQLENARESSTTNNNKATTATATEEDRTGEARSLYQRVTGRMNQALLPAGFSKRFVTQDKATSLSSSSSTPPSSSFWVLMDHVNRRGYDAITHAACFPNVVLQHTRGLDEELAALRARMGPSSI